MRGILNWVHCSRASWAAAARYSKYLRNSNCARLWEAVHNWEVVAATFRDVALKV